MKRLCTFLFCALFCILLTIDNSAQNTDIYQIVPEAQRASLQSRLNEFLEANQNELWDKAFEMTSEKFKVAGKKELKKGIFIIRINDYPKYANIKNFIPLEVRKFDGFFSIMGCGTFRTGSTGKKTLAM